jgi:hypothetical protein
LISSGTKGDFRIRRQGADKGGGEQAQEQEALEVFSGIMATAESYNVQRLASWIKK